MRFTNIKHRRQHIITIHTFVAIVSNRLFGWDGLVHFSLSRFSTHFDFLRFHLPYFRFSFCAHFLFIFAYFRYDCRIQYVCIISDIWRWWWWWYIHLLLVFVEHVIFARIMQPNDKIHFTLILQFNIAQLTISLYDNSFIYEMGNYWKLLIL